MKDFPVTPIDRTSGRHHYKNSLEHGHTFYTWLKHKQRKMDGPAFEYLDHGEQNTRHQITKHLKGLVAPNTNAVDIGCRHGEFTRYLLWLCDHCYCFEYRNNSIFDYNVDTTRVTFFECVVGASHDQIRASGRGKIRSKKIDPQWSPLEHGVLKQTYPLDAFQLENVGLIKIDVDGMDEEVCVGAEKTIEKYSPIIIVEQIDDEHDAVGRLKRRHGYQLELVAGNDHVLVKKR